MIDDDSFNSFGAMMETFILIIIVCTIIFIGFNYVNGTADLISFGDEVRTSDYYTECFNESFEGRVIGSQTYRYTVRDMNGNERTFEKKWLVKTGR